MKHMNPKERIESVTKRIHEEHIAGKGQNSVLHYNLVHKFIPMLQAMNIPDAKAAVDKEWKSLRQFQHGMWEKSKAKRRSFSRHRKTTILSTLLFASLMDLCRIKNSELEATIPEVHRKSCASRRQCERRLWSLCSMHWTGLISIANDGRRSNGCYCSTTWLWRTSSWRNIGVHQSKDGKCSKIVANSQNRNVQDVWIRLPRHKIAQIPGKHWRSRSISGTTFTWSSVSQFVVGKTIRRSFVQNLEGKNYLIGNAYSFIENKSVLLSVYVDDIKMAGKNQNLAPAWKEFDERRWYWGANIISWSRLSRMHPTGMHTKRENHWTIQQDVWVS